tara:strand:- start:679 stop:1035 length:357 start_codon:yes stop_codon:yes gene_type:complete
MPAFYRSSGDYTTEINFPADPKDNDEFEHPGGWIYQYNESLNSWALTGSRGVEGPPGATGDKGPIGDKGPTGDNGKDGANGTDGIPAGLAAELVTNFPAKSIRGAFYMNNSNTIVVGI